MTLGPVRWVGVVGVFAAAVWGCASEPEQSTPIECTETFAGQVSAVATCSSVYADWDSVLNQATVSLGSPTTLSVTVNIPMAGEPHVRSYTVADRGGAIGGVSLNGGWIAGTVFFPTGELSVIGGYTMTLTSVSGPTATSIGRSYTVHGMLDATLHAFGTPDTTQTVTLHAVF